MSKRKKALLGLIMVVVAAGPLLGYKYGDMLFSATVKERAALDSEVDGIFLVTRTDGTFVEYKNGTKLPVEAYGIAVLTKSDHAADPSRLAGVPVSDGDFPVVVFFNASGFDSSGDPIVVRRAKDGSEVYAHPTAKPKRVNVAVVGRDGTYRLYFWDGTTATVGEKEWYATYMGVVEAPVLPPPEELDKMTPEQLKKLGIERLSKEEYEKKFPKLPPPPPPDKVTGPTPKEVSKTGISGLAAKGEIREPLKVPVALYAGRVTPLMPLPTPLATGETDKDGKFAIAVPAGTYTVLVQYNGVWRGSGPNPNIWPAIEVKDTWIDVIFQFSK